MLDALKLIQISSIFIILNKEICANMRGQRKGRDVSGGGEGKEPAFEGDYEALGPFPLKLRGKENGEQIYTLKEKLGYFA